MRDLDRWRDKVELSLDGRQIFFLFFGSAVAACLIFVSGVVVGKRIEARALMLRPPPAEDPLAALDQLGEIEDEGGLTYHRTLTQGGAARRGEAPSVEPTPKPEVEATALTEEAKRAEPKVAQAQKAPLPAA